MTDSQRNLPNWLQAYMAYTNESESPAEYHLWVALSAIAGSLRRNVYFDMGYFLLYPNLYIVLVGPPGRCKKSTAMRVGRGMLGEVPGLHFTVDSTTRESLVRDMTQSYADGQSAMTAYSSEFASFLTSSGMDMVVFLTDIFDSPNEWTHKTKGGGTNKIKSPFLNMIAGTTPDWISKSMPLDTVGIGLTSRVIFVYQDTPRVRPPIPKLTEAQQEIGQLLVEDLKSISMLNGEYTFSAEAWKKYEHWYESRVEHPNPTNDPRLDGYFERKPMHLIKLCMIVAASRRDELVIHLEDLDLAMQFLEDTEERMPQVFAGVGRNPLNADIESMLALAMKNPAGFTLAELIDRFRHSLRMDEIKEAIDMLIALNKLTLKEGRYYYVN